MQIETKQLSHTYNHRTPIEFKALEGVSVKIGQGEFIGIIGPTGSGKTTFIQHLNCLLKPTKGQLVLTNLNNWNTYKERKLKILAGKFDNKIHKAKNKAKKQQLELKKQKKLEKYEKELQNLHKKIHSMSPKIKEIAEKKIGLSKTRIITNSRRKIKQILQIRSKIGIVFQFAEYQLFEETVGKDIMFGPLNLGMPKVAAEKIAKKTLKLVGLPKTYWNKSPFELSGGEKRRVAIAGILAMEPDFLIFDEPTAGLDPVGCEQMMAIFKRLHQLGKTVIIVTHNLDHVLSMTKKSMLFWKGKLIKFGDTYKILNDLDFLEKNNMEPPKLISFVNKLNEKGFKIKKVTSIDELAKELIKSGIK